MKRYYEAVDRNDARLLVVVEPDGDAYNPTAIATPDGPVFCMKNRCSPLDMLACGAVTIEQWLVSTKPPCGIDYRSMVAYLLDKKVPGLVSFPLYITDHGGKVLNTYPAGNYDTYYAGAAVWPVEWARRYIGGDPDEAQIEAVLLSYVRQYAQYLAGDVFQIACYSTFMRVSGEEYSSYRDMPSRYLEPLAAIGHLRDSVGNVYLKEVLDISSFIQETFSYKEVEELKNDD